MSFFGSILSKLGFGESHPGATPAPVAGAATADQGSATGTMSPPAAPVAPTAPAVQAVSVVDVVAKLESLAAAHVEKLNWKTSIVDLLKLLDIDSSLTARKALATELGCPADKMAESAHMNMWLHQTVLSKIAANGGNIPAELLN
jgi:hypothetical protein